MEILDSGLHMMQHSCIMASMGLGVSNELFFIPLAVFIFYPFFFFILILCTRFSLFTVSAWVGLCRVVG